MEVGPRQPRPVWAGRPNRNPYRTSLKKAVLGAKQPFCSLLGQGDIIGINVEQAFQTAVLGPNSLKQPAWAGQPNWNPYRTSLKKAAVGATQP